MFERYCSRQGLSLNENILYDVKSQENVIFFYCNCNELIILINVNNLNMQ